MVNPYLERVKRRARADDFYLFWITAAGTEVGARMTCDAYGHDARAGICERCGTRGVRPPRRPALREL